MTTEVEAKFLDVDFAAVRIKLQEQGGVCQQPMRLMKRAIMDYHDGKLQASNSYIRVRDEGHRITVAYKRFESMEIEGAKEIEYVADSFEKAIELFEVLGLRTLSLQESKRETWQVGDAEVVLDEWPWLKPYIEIEAPDIKKVLTTAARLGLKWEEAVFGDVMVAYRKQYPHLTEKQSVSSLARVSFDSPLPRMLVKDN